MTIYTNVLPYVYKITNKETGEFYIGSRFANVKLGLTPEEDLFIKYFTSSKLSKEIKNNIDKYNFVILMKSSQEISYNEKSHLVVYWYEQLLIKENRKNVLCLNEHYIDPDSNTNSFIPTKDSIEKSRTGLIKFYSDKTKKEDRDARVKLTISKKSEQELKEYHIKLSQGVKKSWDENKEEIKLKKEITKQKRTKERQIEIDINVSRGQDKARDKKKISNKQARDLMKENNPDKHAEWVENAVIGRNNRSQEEKLKTSKLLSIINSIPVSIENVEYPSTREASKILHIPETTIKSRIKSKTNKWTLWFVIQ